MQENSSDRRIDLAIRLLYELKEVFMETAGIQAGIQRNSGTLFEQLYQDSKKEIQEDIDKYKANIELIRQLNIDITSRINKWYEFNKNPDEVKKLFFPVKFHKEQRNLRQFIRKANETINSTAIENRFIIERLSNWEHQLELKAAQLIRQDMDYMQFEALTHKKDTLITELRYLLPTIPDICPIEIASETIELIIDKIKKTPAA